MIILLIHLQVCISRVDINNHIILSLKKKINLRKKILIYEKYVRYFLDLKFKI